MAYLFAAHALVVFHFSFVLFVLAGGLLVVRRKAYAFIHIPAVVWGVLVESMHWQCPLTQFENHLREAGGGTIYEGGFVEHYIMPVLYPRGLTYDFQVTLAILIFTINVIVYTIAFTRPGHHARRVATPEVFV